MGVLDGDVWGGEKELNRAWLIGRFRCKVKKGELGFG